MGVKRVRLEGSQMRTTNPSTKYQFKHISCYWYGYGAGRKGRVVASIGPRTSISIGISICIVALDPLLCGWGELPAAEAWGGQLRSQQLLGQRQRDGVRRGLVCVYHQRSDGVNVLFSRSKVDGVKVAEVVGHAMPGRSTRPRRHLSSAFVSNVSPLSLGEDEPIGCKRAASIFHDREVVYTWGGKTKHLCMHQR